jgi:2-oxo-4-hydroxy-4-carboxy-5-ureidoimidazoline decarboxylase
MPIASVPELDAMSDASFVAAIAPLFEGAPGYLGRLAVARPFGTEAALFARAEEIALALEEAEAVELLDAHPRLGAPPGSVSALSFTEQGYDREAADAAAESERRRVDAELGRLNDAYEETMGFRYCVFVAGRPRAALVDGLRDALTRDRDAELRRGLVDVVRIAQDRYRTLRGDGS